MATQETVIQKLLDSADIHLNGSRPWDPQVKDNRLYQRVFSEGSLGLGEAYMDGWWECDQLDEFFFRVLRYRLDEVVKKNIGLLWHALKSRIINQQSPSRAFHIGKAHYDIGNELYQKMLGPTMAYSCGYWRSSSGMAQSLDAAQEAKFDLICKKVGLKPGMKILDIGCGWGTFMRHAAQKYGVSAVGVTVSEEQAKLARELCQGLPIEIRIEDYRKLNEPFDAIISIGMFEHVGYKNYRTYMEVARRCLKDDGLFLLHTIANNLSITAADPWISKYIFPNSVLPSIQQIGASIERVFVMEDWHNFGADYDLTLMAWHKNFEHSWPELKHAYDERFHRMWRYYLLSCAGLFRSRVSQLWQIVLSKNGVIGGHQSVR